jgi:hypothetical protein
VHHAICVHPQIAFVARGKNQQTVAWNDQRAINRELQAMRDERR